MLDLIKYIVKYFNLVIIKKKVYTFAKTQIPSYKSILVIAPHPDDEILGLGGIIQQTITSGGKIFLLYLTDGEGSGVWQDKEEIKRHRIAISESVCEQLGINQDSITRLHLADGAVPFPGKEGFDPTVKKLAEIIDLVKPEAVFATHKFDYWPYDHVACANLAMEARNQSTSKPQLWYYWVWAWYNLQLNQLHSLINKNYYRVDITSEFKAKKEFISQYFNGMTITGLPWSGVLPKALLKAFDYPVEIIERII